MTSTLLASPTTNWLDAQAEQLADQFLNRTAPDGGWTHERLVVCTVALVRRHGAAAALDIMLSRRPDAHVTRTVFLVWAVERLLSAQLPTAKLLWHPLVDRRSILCWWDAETLDGDEARTRWLPPTLRAQGEGPDDVQPPATAGMIDTVSPSRTGVASPSR